MKTYGRRGGSRWDGDRQGFVEDSCMTIARAVILRAAGTNCEEETKVAAQKAGFRVDILHVNAVAKDPDVLKKHHLLVVPGGFSYGDDLGAGVVFGNELRVRLSGPLRAFVKENKLVLGICNGFQILVRAGLLPDPAVDDPTPSITLSRNDSGRYEDRWVTLKVCSAKSEFLSREDVFELPVAHGEGKFIPRDEQVLKDLQDGGQLVLKYTKPGEEKVEYPWNPNGSVGDVAGICDPTGRVLGLMPHPERFHDPLHHPQWTRRRGEIRPAGLRFFENARAYVKRKLL